MPEAVHVHAPHELTEAHDAVSGRERVLELAAVLFLSLATVCIAWSGYQAARWSGIQARYYARASTARSLANRAATLGGQQRIQDLLNFNRWLETSSAGNDELSQLYVRRFRPEFRPAFEAWLAQDPVHNAAATASPLNVPEYHVAELEKADRLEAKGDRSFELAKEATEHADSFIFGTVFFAAVLFFGGISMRFAWFPMRITVLTLALIFLGYGVVLLASLPTA
jgi:hypothetical protein